MKNNFYKNYYKLKKSKNYIENDKVVIEKVNIFLKLLSYLIAFFKFIFKVIIFLLVIALLSIGATVIFNNLIHNNFIIL